MFKVMIVDDEPFVRKGLALLIDWEKHGFEICGGAENGKKAIAQIEQLKPDVVITDVRMPEMDGLELIKYEAEKLKSTVKFIILSGYDDFKYAQTAIKYGVKQYILKPIDQDELISIINSLHNELAAEKNRQQAYNEEMSRYTRAIAGDTVNMILKGDKSPEVIERAKSLFCLGTGDRLRYVLVKSIGGSKSGEKAGLQQIILEKSVEPEFHNAVFRVSESSCGLLLYSKILKSREPREFIPIIHKNLSEDTGEEHLILVGKEIDDINILDESYKSLRFIESYRFYNTSEKIIYYDDIEDVSFQTKVENLLFDIKLLEAVETGQYGKMSAIVREITEYSAANMIEPAILKSAFSDFRYKVMAAVSQMNGNPDSINMFYSNAGFNFEKININDFSADVLSFCSYCAEYMNELQKSQSKGILQRVEDYLKNNFNDESLNLKNTARHFYINPLYLGQLFKQAYNMRFNDYMHKLRIEEAKVLLRRTDLKIYEIAEKVGYKDADYFAAKFESIEKTTPTQYRKNIIL